MRIIKIIFVFIALGFGLQSFAQTAQVKGVVVDKNNLPVPNVNVSCLNKKTTTDASGFYSLEILSNKKNTILFSHIALKNATVLLTLEKDEVYELNIALNDQQEQMGEVVINASGRRQPQGIISIEPEMIRKMAGANAGIENILKTLPGVNSNNELSTQYSVRGGNYDENLVYVNEIEIYRPFLIRSGQQEGLSFTNSDLVQNVEFSAGGFQAKFGDKLSSVLDITYRKPIKFTGTLEANFLGGSLAIDAVSKNKKWTAVTGARYRNNSLLVNSQDTETNFTPSFVDIQTNVNFDASKKWNFNFLGNISQNKYNYQPLTRQTRFGTIDKPMVLSIFYEGKEEDKYETFFGAFKTTYKATDNFKLKLISSLFQTTEQEYFDILAQYRLGEVETSVGRQNFGTVANTRGIGSQLNHARNDLDALIFNLELKGFHDWKKNLVEWGGKYTRESIRDRVLEWEVIDSAGFSLNPINKLLPVKDEPYTLYTGPLLPFNSVRATNFNTINRFSGYLQWSRKDKLGTADLWYNAGLRLHNWAVFGADVAGKQQTVLSPRAQLAIKPNWKNDMVFRLSGGIYQQPPFYRELRNIQGVVQPNVLAQKSTHWVLSNEYSYKMWNRPFKLVSEVYYKSLTDVNTYTVDNVRIRYAANNNAIAYAQGIDVRLNGEFVPGTESWLSFGYLKTEENSQNRGYIARPTDQRLKFAILFQDYMPNIPSIKLYLNLVYNTGLPGGSPANADPYLFQNRLNDYRRADVGFFKVFIDQNKTQPKNKILKNFKELALGFEIFNLFNNQNAITNTWVRDVSSKLEFGIPNFLTTRVFNLKLNVRL